MGVERYVRLVIHLDLDIGALLDVPKGSSC